MATNAIPVHGGTVSWGTTTTTYAEIAEAKTLILPETEAEYIDVSHLGSSGFRDEIPGLKSLQEITLRCNYTRAVFSSAKAWSDAETQIYFKTEVATLSGESTGDVFEFSGYVTPSVPADEVGNAVMLDLKIRTTGSYTFTAGS